jgi:hypothetical protein
MENSKLTQNERVLAYMREHGSITHFQAAQSLGVQRLASRISDLRRMGIDIVSKWVVVKNRFGEDCRVKAYSEWGQA